jgi:hypothetical protein
MNHPLAILNTSILTAYGLHRYDKVTLQDAVKLINRYRQVRPYEPILSAVGHQATADVLTELLGTPISYNRIYFVQRPRQEALVFKLRGRIEEGQKLTRTEIDEIGYDLGVIIRLE